MASWLRDEGAAFQARLCEAGYALTPKLLSEENCAALIEDFQRESAYRKKVIMQKHDYGRGEYQYFAYPLPTLVAALRESLYQPLAQVANLWQSRLGLEERFPTKLEPFLERCHQAGQQKPTPLILRYGPGDFNRLHRDLYGDIAFPLQVVFLLDEPGQDFTGGEFVLVEQKPRSQSKATVVPVTKGQAVVFANHEYPGQGVRGYRRLKLSHGVSPLRSGKRHTLGIIFHDAL